LKRLELRESVGILDSGVMDGIAKTSKEWGIRLEVALDERLMDKRIEVERLEREYREAEFEKEIAYVGYRMAMVTTEAQTALMTGRKD
jgi:hypothetical protein